MVFKASLDGIAKVFSILFTLLLLSIVVWQIYVFYETPQLNSVKAVLFMLAVLLIPYFYHPLNYHIGAEEVVIRRPFNKVLIRRSEIESIKIVDKQDMKGTLRSFGVAGLYGYYGRFSNLKIGSMLWYATQRRNYVSIQTKDNKIYILTPDKPNDFVQQLANNLF